MNARFGCLLLLLPFSYLFLSSSPPAPACCPAGPAGKPVVNADQTVIMVWDAAQKTQHFIRQASFKTNADDFGFLVPTPSQPELEESGNEAFGLLAKLTAPEIQRVARPRPGMSCACSADMAPRAVESDVAVLVEKRVAGFNAHVLEATSAEALVAWLNDHGYDFSPEVEAWAKPYIDQQWKFTALKVAKDENAQQDERLGAAALRMSFQTDRPLFPYREPDSAKSAEALKAERRLLRIFFLAEARFQGELTPETPWTGEVAWANKLATDDRQQLLDLLQLPETTGPAEYWLTEFEHYWPYESVPADLFFARDNNQKTVKRPPRIQYVQSQSSGDATLFVLVATVVGPLLWSRWRARRRQ